MKERNYNDTFPDFQTTVVAQNIPTDISVTIPNLVFKFGQVWYLIQRGFIRYWQTVQTLIRLLLKSSLIWVYMFPKAF